MAIDFPNSPTIGDSHTGTNGIVYVWDGVKWEVQVSPDSTLNLWGRDNGTSTVYPVTAGDDIVARNGSETTTITLDASTGNINLDGTITAGVIDIDSLTALP